MIFVRTEEVGSIEVADRNRKMIQSDKFIIYVFL